MTRRSLWRLVRVLVLGGIVAVGTFILLVGGLFPAWHAARTRDARRLCENNLRRIGQALRAYESDYGCLPPACVLGANGKPAHSWRVLLLPYLGYRGLYSRYDFRQSWDSTRNAPLVSQMPEVFACPADAEAVAHDETSYMVMVGPRAAFAANRCRRREEIIDVSATTVLVAESPVAGVNWLEPQDILVDQMDPAINGRLEQGIGSYHANGAQVLMADGSVRFLSDKTPSDIVTALLTIDGNEPVSTASLGDG